MVKELKQKWGSFNLTGNNLEENINEFLIDFTKLNTRFRVGRYFEIDALGSKEFFNYEKILNITQNSSYFEGNIPIITDINRDIILSEENNNILILEYDSRRLNRFDRLFTKFLPPTTKVEFDKNTIQIIKGVLDNFELIFSNYKIKILWNTLRISNTQKV